MAAEIHCEVRTMGPYVSGVRVPPVSGLQERATDAAGPTGGLRSPLQLTNEAEESTAPGTTRKSREAVKPDPGRCPRRAAARAGPEPRAAAAAAADASRSCTPEHAPPAPLLSTHMDHGQLVTTLVWPAAAPEGVREVRYVVEQERLGRWESVLTTSEPRAQLPGLARGALHRLRYRVCAATTLGPPSHIATCVIEHASEVDPPLSMEVRSMPEYEAEYARTHLVGHGAYGSVELVRDRAGTSRAAKTVKILGQRQRDTARREFEIMRNLSHAKIVSLIAAFEDKHRFVIITEFLGGGELFERILEDNVMTEADCILYVRQICEGVAYLHHQRVLHLDLKAENIMCVQKGSKLIKIIDFGLAITYGSQDTIYSMFGTRDYVAPEIIMYEPISTKTDMWSVGVITYLLLSGLLPFAGESWAELSTNIQIANFNFEEEVFNSVSALSKEFISSLLVVRQERRLSAVECLNHLWLSSDPPHTDLMSHTKENYKTYLASYKAKWHKAGNVLIAARRLRTNVEGAAAAASTADNRRDVT